MALTVGNLFKESVKYNMKLLAGQEGLCRPVQWIHIIETNEGAQFLHGNEVVITECIAGNDEEKLQRFVDTIYRLHASALIINTGMFIKTVPDSVIAFCEEKQLPLFALPWEVPLVDVTREYCQMIIDNAAQEDTVATIMKDLIFHVGEKDALLHQLERLGFMTTCTMAALCISLHMPHGTEEYVRESRHLKMVAESCAKRIHDQYISFEYREKRILLLINYTPEDLEQYLDSLFKTASAHKLLPLISIGVGDIVKGPENQDSNFMHAYAACKLAARKKERILYYREMGIYKLLIDNENTEALTAFYTDSVGKLKEYDEKNNTEYETFVKMYVACDGHQGEVSEKCFIHRNTVNNYIKKAEEIMGIDLSSWEGKARLYVALCVEDIL